MTMSKEELIEQLNEMEEKKVTAIKEQNYEQAANYRDIANRLREQIEEIDKKHSR